MFQCVGTIRWRTPAIRCRSLVCPAVRRFPRSRSSADRRHSLSWRFLPFSALWRLASDEIRRILKRWKSHGCRTRRYACIGLAYMTCDLANDRPPFESSNAIHKYSAQRVESRNTCWCTPLFIGQYAYMYTRRSAERLQWSVMCYQWIPLFHDEAESLSWIVSVGRSSFVSYVRCEKIWNTPCVKRCHVT